MDSPPPPPSQSPDSAAPATASADAPPPAPASTPADATTATATAPAAYPVDPHDPYANLSPAQAKRRARSLLIIRLVALAMVLVPAIFWLMTSFLMRLNDDKVNEYLEVALATPITSPDAGKAARNAQHALTEISTRLGENDPHVNQFFPLMAKLADHPEPAVRRTVAWVMGDAPGSDILHAALIKLAADPDVEVRYNAGPALSKYNDAEHARPVLTAMLEPYALTAPIAGRVDQVVPKDTGLRQAMQAAVLIGADGKTVSVDAPVAGRVMDLQAHDQDTVAAGQTILLIQPNPNQVFNALVALMLVGRPDDVKLLHHYTLAGNGDMIREQAQSAIDAIEARSKTP